MKEKHWRIGDFAKKIDKHPNTVDGWFKKLEEDHQLHYINRTQNNEKVYDETDFQIAMFINEKRSNKPKWALEAIFDELTNHFELRPFPDSVEMEHTNDVLDVDKLKKELITEIRGAVKEELDGLRSTIEAQQRYIDEKLESRDKQLLETIRSVQENQKQSAAATEEERKGFFARWFGK